MVIRSMNSMFKRHGRILFGLITLIIAVSFLGFLTPGFTGMFSSFGRDSASMGTVFGRKVSFEEMRTQSNRNLIMFSLIYGGASISNSQLGDMASQEAFPALCRIEAAKRRGISIADQQVADFIAKLPLFQNRETKKFDLPAYRRYIDNMLTPNGMSAIEMDEAVRGYLMQQALTKEISDTVLVTPSEVTAFYNVMFEKVDVWIARFKMEDYAAAVKVSDEELNKFFEGNSKSYVIPAKMQALLAVFPHQAAILEPGELTEAAIEKFYQENKAVFGKPLNEVKAKVKDELTKKLKGAKALRQAQIFARDVYDRAGEEPIKEQHKIFTDFAAQQKISLVQTKTFSATDTAAGDIKEPELVKQAAAVYEQVPITNAVAGEKAAYVAFVTGREAPRPAKFNEVQDKVRQEVVAIKSRAAAAQAARDTVRKIVESKERIKEVKASAKPKFTKLDTFSISNPPYGDEAMMAATLSENVAANQPSEARETENGAVVVFVEKRTMPSASEAGEKYSQAEEFYRQKKTGAAMAAFYAWLESKCQMRSE